ncbi:Piso0_000079 [Millerozyma farinosa CBS 7064]|uniref:Piso0_000079 protein n=1 Tax=Pichia sorbitophila (strain ATCC MYA-4447 / BCRC 22081 / CBS 7064 / NBRC 10061 / NRRL Y-12695) TaxID=559304 RepID=G8YUG7_PICSO|nr:Piso0_000079 [Millerozyma farinosa CBS 7064]
MDVSNFVYIIPPYLLNTYLGSRLQKEVAKEYPELALSNTLSVNSPKFFKEIKENEISSYQYSSHPEINKLIRDKLIDKLSITGVLGMDPQANLSDEAYIHELSEIFKNRFMSGSSEGADSSEYTASDKQIASLLDSPTIGEVTLNFPDMDQDKAKFSLQELLFASRVDNYIKFKAPKSFLKLNDGSSFHYALPLTWVPLTSRKYLSYLQKNLNLQINNEDGCSRVKLSSGDDYHSYVGSDSHDESIYNDAVYINFIGDKPIHPYTGIFYYEIEVEQHCTQSTFFKPILKISDSLISSNISSSLSAGFVKKKISCDTHSSEGANLSTETLISKTDLDMLTKDLLINDKESTLNSLVTDEVNEVICYKPGVIKGSYAFSFEDSCFYNSVKNSESIQRLALLNMNRRLSSLSRQTLEQLDSGKISLDVPLQSNIQEPNPSAKVIKSDVVGFGINFIDKSLFLTLNGVLVKVISNESLKATNGANNYFNLFPNDYYKSENSAVYPIIGFNLNELTKVNKHESEPTTLDIKTNFGFQEFKFDINNYVSKYQEANEKFLSLSLLQKVDNNKTSNEVNEFEKALLNPNDSSLTNDLIKGYLVHEGYLDTLSSFNKDLDSLSEEVGVSISNKNTDSILHTSQASNRDTIRKYILQNQYDLAIKFLKLTYPGVCSRGNERDLIFEIKKTKLAYLLRNYLEHKFNLHNYEFDFEYKSPVTEEVLFNQAFSYSLELQEEYAYDDNLTSEIQDLAAALLLKNKDSIPSLPKVHDMIMYFSKNVKELMDTINSSILKELGFTKTSKLETIINNVNERISDLSLKYYDDKFFLMNLERDHMNV